MKRPRLGDTSSLDIFEKGRRTHPESTRNLNDVEESDVAFSALNAPDIIPVGAGALCQVFLRQFQREAQFADFQTY